MGGVYQKHITILLAYDFWQKNKLKPKEKPKSWGCISVA